MPGWPVNVIIDACSIINLSNANALDVTCRLARCRFWVCPGVIIECRAELAARLFALNAEGAIGFITDEEIPATRVLELLDQYGLGAGETESIAACEARNYALCSDDGPARRLAGRLLGPSCVTGSVRLLRWCVEEQLVQCEVAFRLFGIMLARGGFLPAMRQDFFCAGKPSC
jgi:predicted nucleic acid-binding protein